MTAVHHLFEAQALRIPHAPAVLFNGLQLTYAELNLRANLLASQLIAHGVGRDVLVGLCVQRSLEMVIGLLGILKAGGAYLPVDPLYPRDRIGFMLEDSGARAIVTQRSLLGSISGHEVPHILMEDIAEVDGQGPPLRDGVAPDSLAYVIYTSGSTGRPKGVQIEHGAVVNFLNSMRREPGFKSDDVVFALTTLSFDIAVLEILLPLSSGARVIIGSWDKAVDGEGVSREIEKHGVTVLQATPTAWRLLLASGWRGSPRLKALCGGEPMPADLARKLIPLCGELWNMYGPTETTVWSTCSRITSHERITVGRPIDNTETHILDDNLRPVREGGEGELYIGGNGLARGYHRRPGLTAEKFIGHPFVAGKRLYRTGDLARVAPNGELECLGRLDSQIKIRGHRVELGEIETALEAHAGVRQAVIAEQKSPGGESQLIAFFVAAGTVAPKPSELRSHVQSRLPIYMIPAAFVRLDTIPLTPNGKADRRALPQPKREDFVSTGRNDSPATPAEFRLAAIWSKILGIATIGRNDNFFELGGSSLLAAAVFADIEREFGRHLSLALLFEAPTLASLAAAIERTDTASTEWSSLVPIQPAGTKPRFFAVHGAGGNVILYRALVQNLGKDYPFYGLHSRGLDGKTEPVKSVEEMARHYVGEIRRLQPHGPYCIGGYCMGGTIAIEMAQQLNELGESVALLALFDTYNYRLTPPTSRFFDLTERIRFHLGTFFRLSPSLMKGYLLEKIRVGRDGEFARVFGTHSRAPFPKAETPGRSALRTVQAINDEAAEVYEPRPYAGSVTLFSPRINYSKFPDPQMGWGGVVQGKIEIVKLPMNPHAMLVAPGVKHLARALAQNLDRVSVKT